MTRTESAAGTVLAIVIAILGAIALCHWSVCEQDDRQCLITGDAK